MFILYPLIYLNNSPQSMQNAKKEPEDENMGRWGG
jgi:hypothetical protein